MPQESANPRHSASSSGVGKGPARLVGLDVGTSSVKAAAFSSSGELIARSRVAMPPLAVEGPAAWQAAGSVLQAAGRALVELDLNAGAVERVALTAQRDTALLLDEDGLALTPLVSWRDRRAEAAGSLWHALFESDPELATGGLRVRSLTSWIAEAWTGRAAETPATRSRHLERGSVVELERVGGQPVKVPALVGVGEPVGSILRRMLPEASGELLPEPFGGVPLHLTAGDKNCELLGNGIRASGRAGLSLGSAISLGVLSPPGKHPPAPALGTVVTPAALPGRWNVETGLVAGTAGGDLLLGAARGERRVRERLLPDLWCLPYFAGALDRPDARALVYGMSERLQGEDLYQAWAQGVVGELRRLRPALEATAGCSVEAVVVSGGGSAVGAWEGLVADGLEVPVRSSSDPWRGCRGAVAAALLAHDAARGESFLSSGEAALGAERLPDPARSSTAAAYYRQYEALVRATAGLAPNGAPV